MPLQKQNLTVNFASGVDTKTDPWQVSPGKFQSLVNMIFTKIGLLQKRNGFGFLPAPPASSTLATFVGNLLAIGQNLSALLQGASIWVNQGPMPTCGLSVLPLARTSSSQVTVDSVVAPSVNLVCSAWIDAAGNQFYQVQDSVTGQTVVVPTALPATAASPRVFLLGNYFIITFIATVSGTPHLQYIAVPMNSPSTPGVATDLSTQIDSLSSPYDGDVAGQNLYLAWLGSDAYPLIEYAQMADPSFSKINFTSSAMNPDWNTPWSVSLDVNLVTSGFVELTNFAGFLGIGFQYASSTGVVSLFHDASHYIQVSFSAVLANTGPRNIVISYDGSGTAAGVKVYLDGVSQTLTVVSDTLGPRSTVSSNPMVLHAVGGIAQLGMYTGSVLTPTQVAEIYSAGPSVALTDLTSAGLLTHYYPFSGNSNDAVGGIDGIDTLVVYDSTGGGVIRMTSLSSTLAQADTIIVEGYLPTYFSVTADTSGGSAVIWTSFFSGAQIYSMAHSTALAQILAPTSLGTAVGLVALTSVSVAAQVLTAVWQTSNTYSFSAARSDYVSTVTCTEAGAVGAVSVIKRSVGLASKAFAVTGTGYVLLAYGSSNSGALQPTYFLSSLAGNLIAKLAYGNGGGYYPGTVLPSVTVNGETAQLGYLFKFLLEAANPQGLTPPSTSANTYSQVGLNLVSFNFQSAPLSNVEIGKGLHIAGGFVWHYDGIKPVEHNFFLGPEDLAITTATTGGHLTAQKYYYVFCYEWTDGQGIIHRSTPSIPLLIDVSGSGTATNTNTIKVPTLRLTYKGGQNPVRIIGYRWSTAQQNFFQITSPAAAPTLNSLTVDSVTITDTLADSSIIGNPLLYTTGGVVADAAAPAANALTLYRSRVWLIDSEDTDLLWFSKQVDEGTPVEFSQDFTYYAAPTQGAQGSTGKTCAIAPMDDKLIIFKKGNGAIYYTTGLGPDNTNANNDLSDPVFITATVGCVLQQSIVLTPDGLVFDTDKGRWLLHRNLRTEYLGAPVELYNGFPVTSALAIPGTNQIRMTLATGVTLMYDYYYGQWGFFQLPQAVSSVIYNGLHTVLTKLGQVLQESPGVYLDGANPVLMSFTTGWLSLAGLQGYQRAYFLYLLGQYLSPHKLQVQIAYDFKPSPSQTTIITPDNYSPAYGGEPNWGAGKDWGGPGSDEQWMLHFQRQTCQSFQITVSELFDPSFGNIAGPGLTLSGINCVVGIKKPYAPMRAARSRG